MRSCFGLGFYVRGVGEGFFGILGIWARFCFFEVFRSCSRKSRFRAFVFVRYCRFRVVVITFFFLSRSRFRRVWVGFDGGAGCRVFCRWALVFL